MPVAVHAEQQEQYTLVTLEGDSSPEWSDIERLAGGVLPAIIGKPVIYQRSSTIALSTVEISLMLRIHKKAKQTGNEICLCGVDDRCKELLKLTALDTLWPLFETLEQAKAHVASQKQ